MVGKGKQEARPRLGPTTIRQLIVFVAMMPLLLFLVCCRQSLAEEAGAGAIPIPPTLPLASPSVTATLPPQPTATLPPSPTPITEPSPTACPREYFFSPPPPSCPAGEPLSSAAAEQPFEGGVMIWFEATDSIYVFYQDMHWQRFDDTWSEDQAPSDPSFIPPAERFQPIRGFGEVWRTNLSVRDQLGWALGVELAFDSLIQQTEEPGEAITAFLSTFNGQVFALTNFDQDTGEWVIAASK